MKFLQNAAATTRFSYEHDVKHATGKNIPKFEYTVKSRI